MEKRKHSYTIAGNVNWYNHWKTVWRFLKKLKVELPCGPAIPFLGIYPEKTLIKKYTWTPLFIEALFTIATTWKQSKCLSAEEQIKMWYVYTVNCYQKKQGNSRKTSTSTSLTTLNPLTVWITTNWKILEEMGIRDHLTCLMRNLYAGEEATVRTLHGTTNWFEIGKGIQQGYILSACLFNYYAEYIMWNARLDDSQAGIKLSGRNSNSLRYAVHTL